MTTLYRPVLIESAEQAEALPIGTVAHRAVIGGPARYAATRTPSNDWYIGGREFQDHDFMIGWTALVPVEAEEETRDHPGIMLPTSPPRHPRQTRLVTPWEEAQ